MFAKQALKLGLQLDAVTHAQRIRGESRVGEPFGTVEGRTQSPEHAFVRYADHHGAIGGLESGVGRERRVATSLRHRIYAGELAVDEMVDHSRHSGLKQRGIDALRNARLLA